MRIKFWVLTLAITLTTSAFATTFLYNANNTQTQTIDGITVKLEQGGNASNAPAYSSYVGMKLYHDNTITIDAEQPFKNVQLVCSKNGGNAYLTMTASEGNLTLSDPSTAQDDKRLDVWNGETKHLVLTMGTSGQRIIYQIEVDGEPIELNPVNYVDDTPLDPNYVYSEPTIVTQPEDLNFTKKEYAFISNNIRVSCPKGSVLLATDTTEAFFNCNANYTLTFEATKPMKGLAIAGMVRKLFEATVEEPITISYCSPGQLETDWEGDPVVIVKDINANSVTISCPKQVRCYQVRIYFDANPTETLDCEDSEDIQNTESEKAKDEWTKVLREGQLLLQHKDKVFTVTGQAL